MKVVSFDVGIKHLAYCVMEWTQTENIKNNLKVHKWDIINLVESKAQAEMPNCNCLYEKCTGKIKSFIELNNDKYYFCSKHFGKREELLKNKIDLYADDKWEDTQDIKCCKCDENVKNKKCNHYNKLINMSLCNKHFKQFVNNINKSIKKVHTIKNKGVNDLSTYDLKLQLIKCLDKCKDSFLKDIDMVLIENQPTFKNPKMKAISDTLYTWFMVRGVVDKDINNASIGDIKFISPSNKLREFDKKLITDADDTKKYKVTKKLSVENTKTMLTLYGLNDWVKHLISYDKQDDLADSFLQGWYVLNVNHKDALSNEWEQLYNETSIDVDDKVDDVLEIVKTSKHKTKK